MDPKVNYFVVGLFVVILGASVVFFTLWMMFGVDKQVYKEYLIYVTESVSGLSVEAPVKFNGVDVGSVTDINLLPNNPEVVTVKVSVKANTPVSSDTRATMMSQGITGLTFVSLKGGSAKSPKLTKLPGQDLPIIQSSPSLMVRLDATIQNLTSSLTQIDEHVNYLLRKENQDNITEILRSVASMSKTMAAHQDALALSLDAMPLMVKNLSDLTSSAAQAYSNLNGQLSQGLLLGLNNVVVDLQSNPSMLIRGRTPQPLGPGE